MFNKVSSEESRKRIRDLQEENKKLRHNLDTIRDILDAQTDFYILINETGIVIDANQVISGYLGINNDDFIGTCIWDYFPEGISKLTREQADRVFSSREPVRFEDKQDHIWYDVVLYPVANGKKKPEEIAILAHDITSHKQIENLLRFQRDLGIILGSSLKLEEMLPRVLDAVIRIDGIDAGGIYTIDDRTGDMGLIVHTGLPDGFVDDIARFEAGSPEAKIMTEGTSLYSRFSRINAKSQALLKAAGFQSLAIIPIRSEGSLIASLTLVSRDFDEIPHNARIALETVADRIGDAIKRKKTEDLLHIYELIIATVHNPMSFIDRNYRYKAVNNAYLSAFNKYRDEFIGKGVAEIFGEDVFEQKLKRHLDKALTGIEAHFEEWFDYPGMGRRYNILSYYPFIEPDGTVSGVAAISRDITERKIAEEMLMESEARYRNLFESANDPIVILKEGIVNDCNRKTFEVFGISYRETVNLSFHRYFPPAQPDGEESASKWERIFQDALHERPQFFLWTFMRADGSRFDAEVSLNPFELKGTFYVQAIIRDITERKIKEEENIKVSKLESIGTLAGGIAHDFNNLLATILGNIELAQFQMSPDHPGHARLSKAIDACNRSRDLIRQFLTLSKGGITNKKTGPLVPLISDSSHLALSGSRIHCSFDIAPDLWMVDYNENQIMHALHNIIMNAREAMTAGGEISITAKNVTVGPDNNIEHGSFIKHGRYVMIDIRDQGIGIPEEYREKIFDPYFSTKGKGNKKGTGLGLATVYSIIKKHGGYITFESAADSGTVFHVYLPGASGEDMPAEQPPMTNRSARSQILTMDDEEMIREAATEILEHLGYKVESSRNGEEAIEKFLKAKRTGQGFGVVILDLTVEGGMGGAETMKKLKEIDPGVIGIVSSGYADSSIMENYREFGFSATVAKPYTAEELGTILKKCLPAAKREEQ